MGDVPLSCLTKSHKQNMVFWFIWAFFAINFVAFLCLFSELLSLFSFLVLMRNEWKLLCVMETSSIPCSWWLISWAMNFVFITSKSYRWILWKELFRSIFIFFLILVLTIWQKNCWQKFAFKTDVAHKMWSTNVVLMWWIWPNMKMVPMKWPRSHCFARKCRNLLSFIIFAHFSYFHVVNS